MPRQAASRPTALGYKHAVRLARMLASTLLPAILMSQDFRVSLSVSPFAEILLSHGAAFTDGSITAKSVESLQRLFAAHGANEVYARIATTRRSSAGSNQ